MSVPTEKEKQSLESDYKSLCKAFIDFAEYEMKVCFIKSDVHSESADRYRKSDLKMLLAREEGLITAYKDCGKRLKNIIERINKP